MKTRKPYLHEEIITILGRMFACCFEREVGGSYRVICREFADTVAFGETLDAARKHMRAELNFWLDAAYPPEPSSYLSDMAVWANVPRQAI
jgi:hypothetical protein